MSFWHSPKETQVAVIVRTLTATGLAVYQGGNQHGAINAAENIYIDTAKYDIAEEEIQFLVSSKPLQTKTRCLPTHIAIYNHLRHCFINSKFKIAM